MIEMVPFATLAPGGVWGRPRPRVEAEGRSGPGGGVHATAAYIRDNFEILARMKHR